MGSEFAINHAGYRYDFANKDPAWAERKSKSKFYVQKGGLHNTSTKKVKDSGGRDTYLKQAKRPEPIPCQQELEAEATGLKVLWVGMRPTNTGNYASVGQGKGQAIGDENHKSKPIVKHDEGALRVVVPFNKTNVVYYALINPAESMLCEGMVVDKNDVFFFEEFNDAKATSTAKRISSTSTLIKALVEPKAKVKVEPITAKMAQKSELYCKVNQIAAFTSSYLAGGDPSILEMQKLALEEMIDGPRRNKSLDMLLSGHAITDQASAADVVKDIEDTWKSLTKLEITPDEILKLSGFMAQLAMHVPPHYGRAFVVASINLIRRQAKKVVLEELPEVLEDVKMQIGDAIDTDATEEVTPVHEMLSAIVMELDAIYKQYLKEKEALKSYYGGSQLTADNLDVVMARLAVTADVDIARLNVAQMFRLVVEEVAAAGNDFPRRLRDFSRQLRECMNSLNEGATDDDE